MTMTTNATWQTMKPEVAIVSCSPQCLQMKTLLAGARNIFCKKIAGRIESKSTETSCWHDGHLAMFPSREDQLWTACAASSRLGYLVADQKVTDQWRRFVKDPVRRSIAGNPQFRD